MIERQVYGINGGKRSHITKSQNRMGHKRKGYRETKTMTNNMSCRADLT